jgi:hypothetical protein
MAESLCDECRPLDYADATFHVEYGSEDLGFTRWHVAEAEPGVWDVFRTTNGIVRRSSWPVKPWGFPSREEAEANLRWRVGGTTGAYVVEHCSIPVEV